MLSIFFLKVALDICDEGYDLDELRKEYKSFNDDFDYEALLEYFTFQNIFTDKTFKTRKYLIFILILWVLKLVTEVQL